MHLHYGGRGTMITNPNSCQEVFGYGFESTFPGAGFKLWVCVCTLQHVYAWPVVRDLVRIKFGVMARKVVTFGRHRVLEALCMTATLGNKFASLSDVN